MIEPGIDYDAVVLKRNYAGDEQVLTVGGKFRYFEKIGYEPYPEEINFHASVKRFRVVYGARRTGKSMMSAKDVQPIIWMPHTRGWIVAPEYTLGEKEYRYIYEDMIKELKIPTVEKHYNIRGGSMDFKTEFDSLVMVKSIKNLDSLLGEAIDWALFSEAARTDSAVFERYISQCLADRLGIAIFPTTPMGYNWLYYKWLKGKEGDPFWWGQEPIPYNANPYHNPEEFERAKRELGEDSYAFKQEYLGIPSHFTGRCYKTFETGVHVIPEFPIPKDWKKYRGIDPGNKGYFACVWMAVDYHGNHIVYNEFMVKQESTFLHADAIKEISKDERYEYTVVDPAGSQVIDDLNELGIECMAARRTAPRDWKFARVQKVEILLRPDYSKKNPFLSPPKSGASKLYVQDHCRDTINSFISHRWMEQKMDGAIMKAANDKFSHLADAWEFIIEGYPQAPEGIPEKLTEEQYREMERQKVWDRLARKSTTGEQREDDEHLGDF